MRPFSYSLGPVGSAQQAIVVIDTLTSAFRTALKRKPTVEMLVSVTFVEGERDRNTITIRLGDPSSDTQHGDAAWLAAAFDALEIKP